MSEDQKKVWVPVRRGDHDAVESKTPQIVPVSRPGPTPADFNEALALLKKAESKYQYDESTGVWIRCPECLSTIQEYPYIHAPLLERPGRGQLPLRRAASEQELKGVGRYG